MSEIENPIVQAAINIEYYPDLTEKDIDSRKTVKLPIAEISTLGTCFSAIGQGIAKAAAVAGSAGKEGLYYVSFLGREGSLAVAKDGSGYLGTIMNNGIVGQSRLTPAATAPQIMPFDPTMIFMAAAMLNIDRKLNEILEGQKDIIKYLERDKEAETQGNFDVLIDILEEYKHNIDNQGFISVKYNKAADINQAAIKNLKFYGKKAKDDIEKINSIHTSIDINSIYPEIEKDYQQYRLALYEMALSKYIEVLLNKNFENNFVQTVLNGIRDEVVKYQENYTEIYNELSTKAKESIDSKAAHGIGSGLKRIGDFISQNDALKDNLGKWFLTGADNMETASNRTQENILKSFRDYKGTNTGAIIDNLEMIGSIDYEDNVVCFDSDNVYIRKKSIGEKTA